MILICICSLLLVSANFIVAQQANSIVNTLKSQIVANTSLDGSSLEFRITHSHTSTSSGISHYYLNQLVDGIPIKSAVMDVHFKDEILFALHNQFLPDVANKILSSNSVVTPSEAIILAGGHLGLPQSQIENLLEESQIKGISQRSDNPKNNLPLHKSYFINQDSMLILAYELTIEDESTHKWWSILVDASSGAELMRETYTHECTFVHPTQEKELSYNQETKPLEDNYKTNVLGATYTVFPIGVQSPSHGSRIVVSDPHNTVASPFGWHDTNGVPGAEFTYTRGNNVDAKDDIASDNEATVGAYASGGTGLTFDFPFNPAPSSISANTNAAITNLFYWNNIMHDVWYQYGFTEDAGNFQFNNYGKGGLDDDQVFADALDGSGTNNANFSTPPDNYNPRMQMFIWNVGSGLNSLNVNSPSQIAGFKQAVAAGFGAESYNITGELMIPNDPLACNSVNSPNVFNKIALIDRGTCEFGAKCLNAQNWGAVAVLVCNNVAGNPIVMGSGVVGTSVTIPAMMLSKATCDSLKAQLPNVSVTMVGVPPDQYDSNFDNHVIAHEYGHGISTRLTGGAANSGCLNNNEQMGEGWSDWFGLMVTLQPADVGTNSRSVGTYLLNEPTTGGGIRPYPYNTDLLINPHTYDHIKTVSVPHGVGSVWCAMLWDMTWALIDAYGLDMNVYTGTGGNNIAMKLVTEALKLQPCNPGFVDGRNAILLADQAIYGGIHKCLIWKAFARRGLGVSANQGSNNSITDGTQAFDLPTSCCKEVYTTDTSGFGSLPYAASCTASGDTITFAPFLNNKSIIINNATLNITKNLNLINSLSANVTLGNISSSGPLFNIGSNTVLIENLSIIGGNNSSSVITNQGILTLKNTIVAKTNPSPSAATISNTGTINVKGSTVVKGN